MSVNPYHYPFSETSYSKNSIFIENSKYKNDTTSDCKSNSLNLSLNETVNKAFEETSSSDKIPVFNKLRSADFDLKNCADQLQKKCFKLRDDTLLDIIHEKFPIAQGTPCYPRGWKNIATTLNARLGIKNQNHALYQFPRQCSERWHNYLSSNFNIKDLNKDELDLLIELTQKPEYHHKGKILWTEIAQAYFPNRSPNFLKNKFHSQKHKNIQARCLLNNPQFLQQLLLTNKTTPPSKRISHNTCLNITPNLPQQLSTQSLCPLEKLPSKTLTPFEKLVALCSEKYLNMQRKNEHSNK